MSVATFFSGIEAFAIKGEAEIQTLLTQVEAVQAALETANVSGSLIITNACVALSAAQTFLKLAVTDSAPIVAAIQAAAAALEPAVAPKS